MLSDAGAVALTLFAMRIARRSPTAQRTYGYHRAEILAALVNGAALVAIAIFIFVEAVERFRDPPDVAGPLMLVVATGGLVVNAARLWLLRGDHGHSLNIRGAWLHVLTDAPRECASHSRRRTDLGVWLAVGGPAGVRVHRTAGGLLILVTPEAVGGRAHGGSAWSH